MITDPIERIIADGLTAAGIYYIHDGELGNSTGLDFILPEMEIFIEVKQFFTPRILDQMSRVPNIIVIQGRDAAHAFVKILEFNK